MGPARSGEGAASWGRRTLDALSSVEAVNRWIAALSAWSLLAMTLIVTYEVLSRYLFNRPTIWAWDLNTQLMLTLLMLGMAEVYRRDAHVRVDVLTAHLSRRGRALLDVICAPLLLAVALVIVWTGWSYFMDSFGRRETASTLLGPPLYPVKFMLPLGGALLLLQGVVKLARDLRLVLLGGEAERAPP